MECRERCGACCTALSISSAIPGLPEGKPAGKVCPHLDKNFRCLIYDKRPQVCREFSADREYCGSDRLEALAILTRLEKLTTP